MAWMGARNPLRAVVDGRWDISALLCNATWSGSLNQPARTLRLELAYGAEPEVGERVDFFYQDVPLFTGMVMLSERSRDGVQIECMDAGVYLANNSTYKEYRGTPQAITAQVCAEFNVQSAALASRKDVATVTSTGNLSAYQVIVQAYEGEDPPQRQYVVGIQKDALFVRALGGQPVAQLGEGIISAQKSDSIQDMVNRVVILNDQQKTGQVQHEEDRRKYGTFQKTYTQRQDENPQEGARKLLQGPTRRGTVDALGDVRCVTGASVRVKEPLSGMQGDYIIESDSHSFSPAGYEMSLELRREEDT